MNKLTKSLIRKMTYVQLMAFLEEINRPPGGKDSIRQIVQNCFISKNSLVLDVGCNTGFCSFELVHLCKCRVIGIDISKEMIKSANAIKKRDPLGNLVRFQIADGMNLPFKSKTFDVVFSGGSTAFIKDKKRAIEEYARVTKNFGFIADINFYYQKKPPMKLVKKLNTLLDIEIEPWDMGYWINLCEETCLEKFYVYTSGVKTKTKKEIKNYCIGMADQKKLEVGIKKELLKRLEEIMSLFNENHKYLKYCIFIYRKVPQPPQISLFDE